MTNRQASILLLVGGVLVALGSLLPWATLTTGFGSISVNGIEGDGIVTLVLGGLIALLGFLAYGGTGPKILSFLLSLVTLGFGAWELVNLSRRLAENESEFARASIGIGLYLVVGGAIVALVGSLARRPAEAPKAGESQA